MLSTVCFPLLNCSIHSSSPTAFFLFSEFSLYRLFVKLGFFAPVSRQAPSPFWHLLLCLASLLKIAQTNNKHLRSKSIKQRFLSLRITFQTFLYQKVLFCNVSEPSLISLSDQLRPFLRKDNISFDFEQEFCLQAAKG